MNEPPFAGFVRRFVRGLGRARDRDRIVEEVVDHLEQAAAAEERAGADEESARRRAMERFGDARATAAAFPESRRYWIPGLFGLVAAVALVALSMGVARQVERPCGGAHHVQCVGSLAPLAGAELHPLRVKLDIAAAIAAAILTIGFAAAAWRERLRREHAFQAIVASALASAGATTAVDDRDGDRRSVHVALLSCVGLLALVIVAAIGATVRGATTTFARPTQHAFPLQHGAVLSARSPRMVGDQRARPLLRWLVRRMPTGFSTIGVKMSAPQQGVLPSPTLTTTGPAHPLAGQSTEIAWETEVLATAYQHHQRLNRWSAAPRIAAYQSPDEGSAMSLRIHYYTPPDPSTLRATIAANARRAGLAPLTIELPEPDGVAPILIARALHPYTSFSGWAQLLPHQRFIGSLLIIEGPDGYVHLVAASIPNGGYLWTDDPRPHSFL